MSELLVRAGYRPGEPESFRRGAAALMAAQMVALASGLADGPANKRAAVAVKPGRNDPCPCGSGKKYKKCCLPKKEASEEAGMGAAGKAEGAQEASMTGDGGPGPAVGEPPSFGGVHPEMIPRIVLSEMQADTVRLAELFVRDPALGRCRFPMSQVLEHLGRTIAPTNEDARDQWLADEAHAFVQAALTPSGADGVRAGDTGNTDSTGNTGNAANTANAQVGPTESPIVKIMLSVKDAILEAAPRLRADREALRALALGLLFHSSWSPKSDHVHPLELLLFRLALHEAAQSEAARAQVVAALGANAEEVARRLAAGDPEAARAVAASIDNLAPVSRDALMEAAERFHDSVVDAVVSGTFSVPLPLVSVLPLVIETVQVIRRAGADEAKRAAQELAVKRAREGLSAPDRELYVELCDAWLASGEAEDEEAADMVRYARGLAGSAGAALEAVLLLGFLDHHRVSPLPGEPSPDPTAGVEIDSPEFLERYGAFLAQRGNLKLALRTFKLCRYAGEIPPSVRIRIQELEQTLASQN